MAFRELVKSGRKSFPPFITFTAKTEWPAAVQKGKFVCHNGSVSNDYQSNGFPSNIYFSKSVASSKYTNSLLNRNTRFQMLKLPTFLSLNEEKTAFEMLPNSVRKEKYSISHQGNQFIDLFTNNVHKRLYMPTLTINTLKVYQDIDKLPKAIEDNRNIIQIINPSSPEKLQKKEAVRMILIRRRKMRKHKLRKLRKRMKFVYAKRKMKRLLRKEQNFRIELLTQIEAADNFDAKQYVENVLHTLRYHPKPLTEKERRENYRLKMKMNRYQTDFIRPNFDD